MTAIWTMADLMGNDSTEIGDWAELKGLARCQILVIWIAVTGTRVWLKIANAILR